MATVKVPENLKKAMVELAEELKREVEEWGLLSPKEDTIQNVDMPNG